MKRILVAVDFSDITPAILETTAALAGPLKASVTLLHVAAPEPDFVGYQPGPDTVRDAVANEQRSEHRQLQDLAGELQARGVSVEPLLVQGPTVEKLLSEAARFSAEMVVLGSHGHGALHELLLGSTAAGVVRGATCPVVVVPVRAAVGE